jgi:hypothetical protein
MKQQSHQPQEKYAHMRSIGKKTSGFGIATCLGDLSEPDGGVDG